MTAAPSPDDTRERLLAAARAVFASQGFSRARMGDIAQAAQVSRQALYYHFHSKRALASELIRHGLAQLGAEVRAALRESPVEAVVPLLLGFYLRNTDLARLLLLQQVDLGLDVQELRTMGLEALVNPVAERLASDRQAGRVGELAPRIAALAIVGAVNAGALELVLGDAPSDVDGLIAELTTYVRRITAADPRPSSPAPISSPEFHR